MVNRLVYVVEQSERVVPKAEVTALDPELS